MNSLSILICFALCTLCSGIVLENSSTYFLNSRSTYSYKIEADKEHADDQFAVDGERVPPRTKTIMMAGAMTPSFSYQDGELTFFGPVGNGILDAANTKKLLSGEMVKTKVRGFEETLAMFVQDTRAGFSVEIHVYRGGRIIAIENYGLIPDDEK